MIAHELLKNSQISLPKTIDINDAKIYVNVLKQTLQDEIEFISYLIKYKTYNLADSLVTQLFNNICKDIFLYNNIFDIWTRESTSASDYL